MAGRALDIVLHVSETHTAVATRDLRVPMAWYHLERESGGRLLDRRFELNRQAAHPDKVKSWAEVPSAIRNWERALVQWEHMSGNTMDQITKMQTLTSLLPADLKERVTSQLRPDLDYTGMREYVLAQVAREEGRAGTKKEEAKKEEGVVPMELDATQAYE